MELIKPLSPPSLAEASYDGRSPQTREGELKLNQFGIPKLVF
jgi:hypothetical protein